MGKINVEALADAVMKELIEFKDMTEEEFDAQGKRGSKEITSYFSARKRKRKKRSLRGWVERYLFQKRKWEISIRCP